MPPHNPITVLIAFEHALFREGIRLFLAEQPDLEFAGEAAEGLQLLHLVEALRPDVLVLDLETPAAGLETLAAVQAREPYYEGPAPLRST